MLGGGGGGRYFILFLYIYFLSCEFDRNRHGWSKMGSVQLQLTRVATLRIVEALTGWW